MRGVCLPNCINVERPEMFNLEEFILEAKFCELVTLFCRDLNLIILASSCTFKNFSQPCESVDFIMNRSTSVLCLKELYKFNMIPVELKKILENTTKRG